MKQETCEAWLAAILGSSFDAIVGKTLDGVVTIWNGAAEQLYGYTAEEAVGRHISLIVPPDRSGELDSIFERLKRGERVPPFETVRRHRDGRDVLVSLTVSPIADATGRIVGAAAIQHDVSVRRRAEEGLWRRQQELEDFFENGAVALHLIGVDGTILRANRAELDLLGYRQDEYVGRHIAEFHADRHAIDDILARLRRGEPVDRYAARLRCKDGTIRHVLISSNVHFQDGRFANARCFTIDVTDSKQAEEALLESRERLAAALEASGTGTFRWEIQRDELIWDESLARLFGIPLGEAPRRVEEFLRLVHPDDRAAVAADVRRSIYERQPYSVEFRIVHPDSGLRWIADRARTYFDGEGEPVYMTGACRDVTERRRMEEALRARTAELDVIMETVPAALWVAHDPEARRITGSRYGAELLRVPRGGNQSLSAPSDERPRHFRVLRNGVELAEEELPVQRAARGEEVRGEELRVVFDDGDFIHEIVNASPVRDADGTVIGAVGAALDITERKQAEEQRELLIEELNHRVKNTLATVRSMAAYTLETTPEPERFREALEGRLGALAGAHTLLTRGSWHGASLRDLVQEELAPYRPEGGADKLAIGGPDITLAPPTALALGMVLHELATNAAKYGALSRPSGRVEIIWEAVDGPDARRLHLRWTESGGPPVSSPTRRGFGSTVIERSLAYQLDGLAELEFLREGVRCRIELPLAKTAGTAARQQQLAR